MGRSLRGEELEQFEDKSLKNQSFTVLIFV